MTCLITTSQLVQMSREQVRRMGQDVAIRRGTAVLFRIPTQFDVTRFEDCQSAPEPFDDLRPAIIDRIDGNTVTLRVLIQHDVVTPGRWV